MSYELDILSRGILFGFVILSRSKGSLVLDSQAILRCRVHFGRVMTRRLWPLNV